MIGTIHIPNFILNKEPFSKKHQTICCTDEIIIYYLSLLQYVLHANFTCNLYSTFLLEMSSQHKTAHKSVIQ